MFNFEGSQESAEKISTKILEQPKNQTIVVVGHNGPTGLGSKRFDPCGRDFKKNEGLLQTNLSTRMPVCYCLDRFC